MRPVDHRYGDFSGAFRGEGHTPGSVMTPRRHVTGSAPLVRRPENRDENTLLSAARERLKAMPAATARALEAYAHDIGDLSFRCSEDKYRTWEMGRIPRENTWPVICGYFGKSPEELGLRPAPALACTAMAHAVTVDRASRVNFDEEPATQRREFLTATLAASLPAGPPPARVELRHVRDLTTATLALRQADQLHGGSHLVAAAHRLLTRGQHMVAAQYTDLVGRQLHSAIGWLGVQVGWLAYDAGQMDRAAGYYRDALVAASVSRDDAITVNALACYAYYARESGRQREALAYLRAAHDTADRWAPPALRSLLCSRQAAQCAALGDLTAFQRLSGEAHDVYEPPAPDLWYSFVDQGELFAMEGYGLAAGGSPSQAVSLFNRAVADTSPQRRRNAVSRSLLLARATLAAGDPNGAVAHATPVLAALRELNSARLRGSLDHLRTALTAHRSLSAVRDFDEQTRAHTSQP